MDTAQAECSVSRRQAPAVLTECKLDKWSIVQNLCCHIWRLYVLSIKGHGHITWPHAFKLVVSEDAQLPTKECLLVTQITSLLRSSGDPQACTKNKSQLVCRVLSLVFNYLSHLTGQADLSAATTSSTVVTVTPI